MNWSDAYPPAEPAFTTAAERRLVAQLRAAEAGRAPDVPCRHPMLIVALLTAICMLALYGAIDLLILAAQAFGLMALPGC